LGSRLPCLFEKIIMNKTNNPIVIPTSINRIAFKLFFSSLGKTEENCEWRAIKGKNVCRITGKPDEKFDELYKLNQSGFNIFVTINDTDGKDIKGANVREVRALFADFDGTPLANLNRIPLEPSFTVNTSPNKHHAYWLVDDCPLEKFTIMQKQLAHILESDPAVCDLGRIMRVPGFYHLKSDPYLVTIATEDEVKHYSYEDFSNSLPNSCNMPKGTSKYSLSIGCEEGSRNTTLTKLAGKLIYDCLPDTEAITRLKKWNSRNNPPLDNDEVISTYYRIKAKDDAENGESRKVLKELNDNHAIVMVGTKAMVLKDGNPHIFMAPSDFHTLYAHKKIGTKKATKLWIESDKTRRFDNVVFDPSMSCSITSYNLFKGLACTPRAGKCDLFLEHVMEVICSGDHQLYEYVIGWMAHAVQKPTELPGVALILMGSQGTGKGTFAQYFGKIFGEHFQHLVHMDHLLGKFNAHLSSALLVFADEVVWGGNKKEAGQLKGIITESRRMMEAKFKDPIHVDNYARFIFATNEDWAVPTGPKERRFCVLNIDESKAQNHSYFSAIKNEMINGGVEALMHVLVNYDISKFNVRRYPETDGLLAQKQLSLPSVASWWQDILMEGFNRNDCSYLLKSSDIIGAENPTSSLFKIYQDFAKEQPYGHSKVASCNQFVTQLKEWAPVTNNRVTDKNGKRSRCLVIPDLETCKAFFEKKIGHKIDWDAD
jgi:hypothetical protein